ncbi:RNA recognition motif domain-containing protein [Aliidiomarina sp. Khilg15.8]
MTRVTPAAHILLAAVLAIIAGLLSGVIFGFAEAAIISTVGIFTFLSGVLTPWLALTLATKQTQGPASPGTKKSPAAAPKQSTGGQDQVTLYVGNLPFKTSEESVEETFARYGEVSAVRLVKDRRTGKRKGYGFVEMESVGADLALAKLNDSDFEGRTLKVRAANSDRKD